MKRKSVLGMLALIMLVASFGAASAFGGNFFGMDSESRDTIVNAIKAEDYNAWKEAMSAQLTEDNFNRLVERHEAMEKLQDGNYTKVREVSEQLGLPDGFGKHKMFGHFGRGEMV